LTTAGKPGEEATMGETMFTVGKTNVTCKTSASSCRAKKKKSGRVIIGLKNVGGRR